MGFPVSSFVSALDFVPGADDRILVTYPKCGTTWVQNIIYLLLHDGQPLRADQRLDQVFPHLEEAGASAITAMAAPRLVKTHLPLAIMPLRDEPRYVYVARNPFDSAVSFFHHTRGFPRHYDFANGTFDEFFECFITGHVDFGDYFDHLLPWIAASNAPNVLFLTYEALLEDTAAGVRRIAAHLGGRPAAAARNPDVLAAVLAHSGFDAMCRDQQRWSSARPAGMPAFVRRGQVGDWRRHFSDVQARRLAARFRARTQGSAAATLWPDIMADAEAHDENRR
jgi:sulfotransferase